MPDTAKLLEAYASGPEQLRQAVEWFPESELDSRPVPGKWSVRQVVCHLADAEVVYADRMKRVLAEEAPMLFDADPDEYVPALYCPKRSIDVELRLIDVIRSHMLQILRSCGEEEFMRTGTHSLEGEMTLATLLERIVDHIPHHTLALEEKKQALQS